MEGCKVPKRIGLDASEKRLAIARKYCSQVIWWDLNEVPLPLVEADCVLCLEVIEHLPEGSGQWLLEQLGHYRAVILSTPREFFAVRRNGYEAHLSHWPEGILTQLYGFRLVKEWDTPPSNIYVRQV